MIRPPLLRALHRCLASLLLALSVLLAMAGAAAASTSISPTQAEVDQDVSLTLTTTSDSVDLTSRVVASIPDGVVALACGAPDGWSCQVGGGSASWQRQSSLAPDQTFTLAIRTPSTPGDVAFQITDTRTSGASTTNVAVLSVVGPEPSEEPSDPSEEPTEDEAPEVQEPQGEAPPLEPFRPPDGDDEEPISIRDLPSDDGGNDDAGTADQTDDAPTGGDGPSFQGLLVYAVAGLLLSSAIGFTIAQANR